MTPFAQLSPLEKPAMIGRAARAAGRGIRELADGGVWKAVGSRAKPSHTGGRKALNALSRVFYNPSTGEATRLASGMNYYGMAGLLSPLAGVSLPGSDLAFAASAPGMSALFAAPGAIQAARAGTDRNAARLKADAQRGATAAAGDFLALAQRDPGVIRNPALYGRYVDGINPYIGSLAGGYRTGRMPRPQGLLGDLRGILAGEGAQPLINRRVDQAIVGGLRKAAMLGALGKAWRWAVPAMGAGMIGHALLRDKPYDEAEVFNRGYAGGQAAIQGKLSGLGGLQGFAAGLDPTLMAPHIEKALPGTLDYYRRNYGQLRPGFLGRMAGVGEGGTGDDQEIFTYDAAGNPHYL